MTFVESSSGRVNDYFSRLEADDEDGSEFIDGWDTGELLCLASAVQRSGDKNWVSVSRSIKPFGEQTRPSDWYTPKNCALQYSKLLKGVEDLKKKALPRTERETSEEMLVKSLTDKRLTELAWLNQQTRATAHVVKNYLEMVDNGEFDEHIDELLKQIEEQEKCEEEDFSEYTSKRENLNATKKLNKCRITLSKGKASSRFGEPKRKNSPNLDPSEDAGTPVAMDVTIKTEVDTDDDFALPAKGIHIKTEMDTSPSLNALLDNKVTNSSPLPISAAPTSPLLTSLLRNVASTPPGSSVSFLPLKEVKVESSSHHITVPMEVPTSENSRKNEVFLSPSKIPTTGVSPLLTSLLKSPTSAAPLTPSSNSMTSLIKEETIESPERAKSVNLLDLELAAALKSRETSPRGSVPQSPQSTSASSPLLNSLLKNSPSSTTPISQSKEAITPPKAISSPQPFFNPASALATAAAQQLAVATSTLPQSLQFLQQHDSAENRKLSTQSSPVTSACLSAPTLSKLLEMPPSTPGRLPPLPVIDPPASSTPSAALLTSVNTQSPSKDIENKHIDKRMPVSSSMIKKLSDKTIISSVPETPLLPTQMDSGESFLEVRESNEIFSVEKIPLASTPLVMEEKELKNLKIIKEVCESIDQAFLLKEIKKEPIDIDDIVQIADELPQSTCSSKPKLHIKTEKIDLDDNLDSNIATEKVSPCNSDKIDSKVASFFVAVKEEPELSVLNEDIQCSTSVAAVNTTVGSNLTAESTTANKINDVVEMESGASEKKFYRSRVSSKKRSSTEEDVVEKASDAVISPVSKQTPKKTVRAVKAELEISNQSHMNDTTICTTTKENEECSTEMDQDSKPPKVNEAKSPISKKPRIFEKALTKETRELSEDETPLSRRLGRRAKKGRGKVLKSLALKQEDPKDQYEFTESTEENSVGYQTANTLCYMPRPKDEIRGDDSKNKLVPSQDPEVVPANSNTTIPTAEKFFTTPLRSKQGRPNMSQMSSRKGLFTSDEEKMSDSLTSDETSNQQQFVEDKVKRWKESSEKQGGGSKDGEESNTIGQHCSKITDSVKKKCQSNKRSLSANKTETPNRKEKKTSNSDLEESSACSRDSEDVSGMTNWQRREGEMIEEKIQTPVVSIDVEVETNDSHVSSVAAESDKQVDDMEGYESQQGSIVAEFSPLPSCEIKEEKNYRNSGNKNGSMAQALRAQNLFHKAPKNLKSMSLTIGIISL